MKLKGNLDIWYEKIESHNQFFYCQSRSMRHMLLEKERMTFSDFERLTYLTDFFGLTEYNLEIWGKFAEQFKSQFNALCTMYEEVDLNSHEESNLGEDDEDGQLYDIWVRDFCRQAPNKELRLWLEGQATEIYKEQGLEPFGLKERS